MMRSLIENDGASAEMIDSAAPQNKGAKVQCRVAFLTNTVPPAEKCFFLALQERFSDFHLFLSSPQEAKNLSSGHWDGLHSKVQRSLTLRRQSRHPIGFSTELTWDIPWDTPIQLARCRPDLVISARAGIQDAVCCAVPRISSEFAAHPVGAVFRTYRARARPAARPGAQAPATLPRCRAGQRGQRTPLHGSDGRCGQCHFLCSAYGRPYAFHCDSA